MRGTPTHMKSEPRPPESIEGHVTYDMCDMWPAANGSTAGESFRAAIATTSTDPRAAAQHYFDGAIAIAQSANAQDSTLIYNRRVAYANGTNLLLLGKDDLAVARAALQHAATLDADLATELHRAAAELPNPMNCNPPEASDRRRSTNSVR